MCKYTLLLICNHTQALFCNHHVLLCKYTLLLICNHTQALFCNHHVLLCKYTLLLICNHTQALFCNHHVLFCNHHVLLCNHHVLFCNHHVLFCNHHVLLCNHHVLLCNPKNCWFVRSSVWQALLLVTLSIGYFGFLATFSPTYGWMLLLRGLVGCGMGGSTQGWGRKSVCFSLPCWPMSAEVDYLFQICTCRSFREIKQKPAVLYRNCASSLCFLFGKNKQKPAVLYRSYASSFLLFSVWGEQAETGCFIQKLRVITLLFSVWVSPNRKQPSDDPMSEMSKNSLRTKDLQSDDAETSRNRLFYTEAMHHHFCCFLFLSAGPAIPVTADTTLKINYVSVAIFYLMFAPLTDSWR